MFLDWGRLPENLDKSQAGMGRACEFHRERPVPGYEPMNSEL